ncbi:MAG TPA: 3-hydroxyacyl-CoA dehydrogenase NAD-binding domain-containing protein, partial [Nitrospiria bacterium]|nr:3-hydroxyacyl-CoA dehydrogenase NAD-binding domain-containing protein [Nitrospiria bacterium]
ALRMGLIDRLATTKEIKTQALSFMGEIIKGGTRTGDKIREARRLSQRGLLASFLERTGPGRSIVFRKAREAVLEKTKGRYPAPLKIIDIVREGMSSPIETALRLEQEGIEYLMRDEVTENLMHVFSLRMGAGKILSRKDEPAPAGKINKVGVLGAGAMGSGIAQWLLGRGFQVRLKDINEQAVSAGIRNIHRSFDKLVSRRKMTGREKNEAMRLLSTSTAYTGFSSCDLVIEAVADRLDIKKAVLEELQAAAGSNWIFGTNTSSLSVDAISKASKDPSRVLGLHFFNPVSKMPLVEVVKGRETSAETLSRGIDFIKAIGKIPLIVSDSPGFLVNRILMAYANEAGLLL